MNKTGLIQLASWPLSGASRKWLKQLLSGIHQSRGATIFRAFIHAHAAEAADDNPAALSAEQLAYALPSHKILSEDPTIQRARVGTQQQLGLPLLACLYWLETPSLQLRFPMPLRRSSYEVWWQQQGPKHYKEADRALEAAARQLDSAAPFSEKAFGVNLIGHAYSVFGLGEYLRMIAKALEAADVPFCVVNIPATNGAKTTDDSLKAKSLSIDAERPYAFSIYCMTADTHLDLARHGDTGIRTYSIATWFWELDRWPQRLTAALVLADEYWPCTDLIHRALQGAKDAINHSNSPSPLRHPILTIPPVVDLGHFPSMPSLDERQKVRKMWGLDPDAILFSFSFDLNSRIARKNPQAVVNAFLRAFPKSATNTSSVGMVIKSFPPRRPEPLWEELKTLVVNDPRITIIEQDLDRSRILSLYGCCDCFVSLHRSEGLGLGMAEAFQLGLDVIATHYGGNVDFCSGPLAHPVPYQLIPVEAGEYPDHEGMVWAEPDIVRAAELMVDVAQKRFLQPITSPEVIDVYRARFSAMTVGAVMRHRLEELWRSRLEMQRWS